nr:aldehyde dehydrogenase family protein [Verminephrobacter eiseniae]
MLSIHNPATGELVAILPADDAASVAAKSRLARAAQTAWARVALQERLACVGRFRAGVVRELESLARTMTQETGKPITMSRNELNGLLARIDFFSAETAASIASETVFDDATTQEQIEHVPLGLIANISAWNYPWFVGSNVLIPALLTGNAVLYKPSEFAALTGLAMTRLWHEAGVPKTCWPV